MIPDRRSMDRYILSYSTQVDYALYGQQAIVAQLIDTDDIEQAIPQFLSIVSNLRGLPLASFTIHSIECIVNVEKVDAHGMPLLEENATTELTADEAGSLIALFDGCGGPSNSGQRSALEKLERIVEEIGDE